MSRSLDLRPGFQRGPGLKFSLYCNFTEFGLYSLHCLINNNMSQDQLIKLACKTCKRVNYWSRKNKKKVERKIELKKYCKWCKKNTTHKEAKK